MVGLLGAGGEPDKRRLVGVRGADAVSDYEQVTVEVFPACGQRQFDFELARPVREILAPGELLGRVLGLYHWPAKIPAALDIHAHFQPTPLPLAQRMLVQLPPFRCKKSRTVGNGIVIILVSATGVAD